MATLIVMPRLSPTMEEGVLAKWTKQEGDKISPGDIIAEVETDKANMDFPLEDEGVLLKLLVGAGDTVRLGGPVAILGDAGEDIGALLAEIQKGEGTKAAAAPAQAAPAQAQAAAAAPAQAQAAAAAPAQAQEAGESNVGATGAASADRSPGGRVIASPLSRKLATEAGLDIRQIRGSGPGGRVIKRDIEQAVTQQQATAQRAPAPPLAAPASAPAEGDQTIPMSMMRKTIARRLTEAKQTVPHFYLTTEATVDELWRFREQLNAASAAAAGKGEAAKVSINDLVVKATARALSVLPAANMSFSPEGAVRHARVDVGVAVAIEDGLMTPVVRNADRKSVGAISAEIRELAERAKLKKLRPDEYQGGTFSVSNLGMFGIREFFAIINPPESGILAVGKVEKRPVVVEQDDGDQVVIQRRMTLTLSCDHRILDGTLGARLLAEVVKALEHPLLLVL